MVQIKNMAQFKYMQIDSRDYENKPDLLNPEIWICDTSTITHNTTHNHGGENMQEATAIDDLVGVARPLAKAKTIMDISTKIHNDSSNAIHMVIKDVTHVLGDRYNWFSVTRMILKGWNLTGDLTQGLTLSKNKHAIRFNKRVHMTKIVLFVAMFLRLLED